jgi:hypothetical protein
MKMTGTQLAAVLEALADEAAGVEGVDPDVCDGLSILFSGAALAAEDMGAHDVVLNLQVTYDDR